MSEREWEAVTRAAVRLQRLVPDAVLVGGTGAALHADHRVSFDDDHVVADLRERFDEILDHLEQSDGWNTARVNRPVLILGSLDGVETGVRQLIRRRKLEVELVETPAGPVRAPTLEEMLRVKAWLVLRRNATRDYLDVAALADRLEAGEAAGVLLELDTYYEDQLGAGGRRIATQVARQLAEPAPYDLSDVDLRTYRRLEERWRDWEVVAAACSGLAVGMLDRMAGHTVMEHRHLEVPATTPVSELGLAALDDILERGDLDDWAPLLREVRRNPQGVVADRILHLVDAHAMQGVSPLWRAWITDARATPSSRPLGAALAALRRQRGMTQQQLGERLGMTQPEISRLEGRSDLRVRLADDYVGALGGRLELTVRLGRKTTTLNGTKR